MTNFYGPASGTEGMDFIGKWCGRCACDENDECPILADSFTKKVPEWRLERGEPVCTGFQPIDPTDLPHMETAAVRDLFPGSRRRLTQGQQIRAFVGARP